MQTIEKPKCPKCAWSSLVRIKKAGYFKNINGKEVYIRKAYCSHCGHEWEVREDGK